MIPLGDDNPTRRFPIVNTMIIIVNIAIFFYTWLSGPVYFEKYILTFGAIPHLIVNGSKLWTLITSMFLHASPEHLIGNMLFLAIFGDNVEDRMGHTKYLIFYIIAGLGAHIFHILSVYSISPSYNIYRYIYWRIPDPKLIPAVGASGAISGVLGAYLFYYPNARVKVLSILWFFPVVFMVPAFYFIGVWFLFQLAMGLWTLTGVPTGVAFWAHIGGFLTGLALASPLASRRRFRVLHTGELEWY